MGRVRGGEGRAGIGAGWAVRGANVRNGGVEDCDGRNGYIKRVITSYSLVIDKLACSAHIYHSLNSTSYIVREMMLGSKSIIDAFTSLHVMLSLFHASIMHDKHNSALVFNTVPTKHNHMYTQLHSTTTAEFFSNLAKATRVHSVTMHCRG